MTIIGDVHGLVDRYWKLLHRIEGPTVQLGDFGFRQQHLWHLAHVDHVMHRVLFGNHDYYPMLHNQHSLGNWLLEEGILYVRGARSVDRYQRTEGVDWWAAEELDHLQCTDLVDFVELSKRGSGIRAVVSHDCPQSVTESVFGFSQKSRTGQVLQRVLEIAAPRLWVFGHHHESVDVQLDGTRFRGLAELEPFELPGT